MPIRIYAPTAPIPPGLQRLEFSNGGHGTTSPEGAVAALGGIPRNLLGRPNGLAISNANGTLSIPQGYVAIGQAVEGPRYLTRGGIGKYFISNMDFTVTPSISVDVGVLSIIDHENFTITAPLTGNRIVLNLNGRLIPITLIDSSSETPEITYPPDEYESETTSVTFFTSPYKTESEVVGEWIDAPLGHSTLPWEERAFILEVQGNAGHEGLVEVNYQGRTYNFPMSQATRRIRRDFSDIFNLIIDGDTATARYRFITPDSIHTATDWQISRDAEFTDLAVDNQNDYVNLTQYTATLSPGMYYVRARFISETT